MTDFCISISREQPPKWSGQLSSMCAIALFQPEPGSKGFLGLELLDIKLVATSHFEGLTASQIGSVHYGYCTGILISTDQSYQNTREGM